MTGERCNTLFRIVEPDPMAHRSYSNKIYGGEVIFTAFSFTARLFFGIIIIE